MARDGAAEATGLKPQRTADVAANETLETSASCRMKNTRERYALVIFAGQSRAISAFHRAVHNLSTRKRVKLVELVVLARSREFSRLLFPHFGIKVTRMATRMAAARDMEI